MLIITTVALATIASLRGMWSPCGLSMLTSLNPMAERTRGHRFAVTAGWYVLGALVGGAVLGSACAAGAAAVAVAAPSATVRLLLAAVISLVGVASDLRVRGWALPDHPRQVNERWLSQYRRWIYAGGFGAQIGAGFATYIMTAAVYVVAGLAVLSADPLAAISIGLVFGGVRGMSILVAAGLNTPARLIDRAAQLERLAPVSVFVVVLAQLGVATACAFGAATMLGFAVLVTALVAGAVVGFTLLAREPTRAAVRTS